MESVWGPGLLTVAGPVPLPSRCAANVVRVTHRVTSTLIPFSSSLLSSLVLKVTNAFIHLVPDFQIVLRG